MAFEPALGMERLCTIREIADRVALGTATVHRALKNGREVRPETRRLVLDTVCRINEEKIARAARYGKDWSGPATMGETAPGSRPEQPPTG